MTHRVAIGRHELLQWLNQTLQTDYTRIEQCADGVAYSQLIDIVHPDAVSLNRLNFNARREEDFVKNLRVLQEAIRKNDVQIEVPVDDLARGKFQENHSFLKLIYAHTMKYGINAVAKNYAPYQRRMEAQQQQQHNSRRPNSAAPTPARRSLSSSGGPRNRPGVTSPSRDGGSYLTEDQYHLQDSRIRPSTGSGTTRIGRPPPSRLPVPSSSVSASFDTGSAGGAFFSSSSSASISPSSDRVDSHSEGMSWSSNAAASAPGTLTRWADGVSSSASANGRSSRPAVPQHTASTGKSVATRKRTSSTPGRGGGGNDQLWKEELIPTNLARELGFSADQAARAVGKPLKPTMPSESSRGSLFAHSSTSDQFAPSTERSPPKFKSGGSSSSILSTSDVSESSSFSTMDDEIDESIIRMRKDAERLIASLENILEQDLQNERLAKSCVSGLQSDRDGWFDKLRSIEIICELHPEQTSSTDIKNILARIPHEYPFDNWNVDPQGRPQ